MPDFVFGQSETRRIAGSVRWSELERKRLRTGGASATIQPPIDSFINNSGTGNTVPAHGILAVLGDGTDADEKLLSAQQPDDTLREMYIVNDFEPVENAATGRCHLPGRIVHVAYDTGTPAFGETWGVKAGQSTASRNGVPMFIVLSIVDETAKIMRAWFDLPRWLLSRVSGSWSADSSAGGLPVYGGAPGAEQDSGIDVTAFNRGPQFTVSGATWIGLEWNGEGWYLDRRQGDDIKVKATVNDSTAGFLGEKLDASTDPWIGMTLQNPGGNEFYRLTHDGPVSGEATVTIGQATMKATGAADTTAHDFTTSAFAGEVWVLCGVFQEASDPTSFDLFPRKIQGDSNGHSFRFSGEASPITITLGASTDEKVAVVDGQPAGYLSQVLTNWYGAATFDPNKDIPIHAEQDTDNALFFLDFSTLPGYNSATAGQVIGHEADGTVACIVFVGDGQWISVAYTASTDSWDFSHGNPKNETANIVTLGSSSPSGTNLTADTATFTANGTDSLEAWLPSRTAYDSTNKKFVQFFRKWKFDSKGHGPYTVGGEQGPVDIIDLVNCTTV